MPEFNSVHMKILWGNISLIVCCAFYLAWWLLAFKPEGGVRGIRTGWLLIPAFIAGIFAVISVSGGMNSAVTDRMLYGKGTVMITGIVTYVILVIVTYKLMNRPVTTELFLIIGWAVLVFLEINTLYGMGDLSILQSVIFCVITVIATVISMIAYCRYYGLDPAAGYIDGMIPLIMCAVVMAAISIAMCL